MRTEATDLIESDGPRGRRARHDARRRIEIRADLVVGCDGRHSTVRERAGLTVEDIGRADRRAVVPPVAQEAERPG